MILPYTPIDVEIDPEELKKAKAILRAELSALVIAYLCRPERDQILEDAILKKASNV